MNKGTRNRLLALAKVFDGWAQRIRAKVKAGTPKRARKPLPFPNVDSKHVA